jgi:hypothetical protein
MAKSWSTGKLSYSMFQILIPSRFLSKYSYGMITVAATMHLIQWTTAPTGEQV